MGADCVIAVDVMPKVIKDFRKNKYGLTDILVNGIKQNALYRSLVKEEVASELAVRSEQKVNILEVFLQSMNIGHTKLAEYQILSEKPDVVIRPDTEGFSAYEFHKGQELIDNAYTLTKKIISDGMIPLS